jgi:hypothetical protein
VGRDIMLHEPVEQPARAIRAGLSRSRSCVRWTIVLVAATSS